MSQNKDESHNHPKKRVNPDDVPILAPPPIESLETAPEINEKKEVKPNTTTTTSSMPSANDILETAKDTLNWTKDTVVNTLEKAGEKMGILNPTTTTEEKKPLLPTEKQGEQHTLLQDVSEKASQITSQITSAVSQGYEVAKEKVLLPAGTFISEQAKITAEKAQHLASDIQHKVSETIHPSTTTTTEMKEPKEMEKNAKPMNIDVSTEESSGGGKSKRKSSNKNKRNERSPKHEENLKKGTEEESGEKFMKATANQDKSYAEAVKTGNTELESTNSSTTKSA